MGVRMYQEIDKKKVQEHILDIFRDIIRVCDELDINYFIMGGTALGAVRHGGFIPWDDDLDIGMLRTDYERFLKEAPQCLRGDLFLQTFESEPRSPFYFAKVRKSGTEFTEYYCRKLPIHSGIYVDIFPYDSVPDEVHARKGYYWKSKCLLNLYIAKEVTETSVPHHGWHRIAYFMIRNGLHILLMPVSKNWLYRRLDHHMQRYNTKQTVYVGDGGNPGVQLKRKYVKQPEKICFEGTEVKCPKEIEEYLHDNYGDYHKLPPENERKGHAPYQVRV